MTDDLWVLEYHFKDADGEMYWEAIRTGTEADMATGGRRSLSRLCGPCVVTWTAGRLLNDGTGSVSPPLKPLAGALAAITSPAATLDWLGKPHIGELLTHLAAGTLLPGEVRKIARSAG